MFPSRRVGFITLELALAAIFSTVVSGLAAPPVFDTPPVLDPAHPSDPPKVPIGKALVVPIAATAEDGGAVSLKVTSSNARLPVRVKTGNPILRIHVSYAGDGAAALPFEGNLDFQLYRDLTPRTSGFIAGFAHAGYYDGLKFHRVIEGFMAQGGDPAGTGNGIPAGSSTSIALPFEFENEFHPGLIFSGRGQLAMANKGINRGSKVAQYIQLGDFRATNGSQFFITFRQPRYLDFDHTIFGQLIRGFDVLDKIEAVPKVDSSDADTVPDKPIVDVKMTSVTVLPAAGEATLFIGATGVGESTITVFATDSAGAVSKQIFTVRAVDDTVNDPPLMLPIAPIYANVGTQPRLQVNAIDLEFDSLRYQIAAAGSSTSPGAFGEASLVGSYNARQTAGLQTLAIGVAAINDERLGADASADNPFAPFDAYSFEVSKLVFGDRPPRPVTETIKGAPAVPLTDVIVGRLSDLDAAASPASLTATINWGDGTATSAGTLSRDPATPGAASYVIRGTHTYAKAGIYTVLVTITGDKGATAQIGSSAVISAAPIVAWGTHHEASGAALSNRIVAYFTDSNPSRRVADYVATIDWGDGARSRGAVTRAASGDYIVRGTHSYKDSQSYSIIVRIDKKETPTASDAVAWSSARMQFKSAPYLPPFPQAHFALAWNSGPSKAVTTVVPGDLDPGALQVQLSGNLFLASSGNRTLAAPKVRFWLSDDATLQTTDTRLAFDAPVFQLSNVKEVSFAALAPGIQGAVFFRIFLPKGESGAGKFLLSEAVYSDPIADHSVSGKVVAVGRIDPAVLVLNAAGGPLAGNLQTTEAGGQATFRVVLDTAPTADVTIPIESSLTTEGTVSPAQLVFTPANWNVAQTVTVTGVDDTNDDGNKAYTVTLKAPVTAPGNANYRDLPARTLNASNTDND